MPSCSPFVTTEEEVFIQDEKPPTQIISNSVPSTSKEIAVDEKPSVCKRKNRKLNMLQSPKSPDVKEMTFFQEDNIFD